MEQIKKYQITRLAKKYKRDQAELEDIVNDWTRHGIKVYAEDIEEAIKNGDI